MHYNFKVTIRNLKQMQCGKIKTWFANTNIDFHCLLIDVSISKKEIVLWYCLYSLKTQLYSIIHCATLWYTFIHFCTLLLHFWYFLLHFCNTFDTRCYTFDTLLIHYYLLRSVWLRFKIDKIVVRVICFMMKKIYVEDFEDKIDCLR